MTIYQLGRGKFFHLNADGCGFTSSWGSNSFLPTILVATVVLVKYLCVVFYIQNLNRFAFYFEHAQYITMPYTLNMQKHDALYTEHAKYIAMPYTLNMHKHNNDHNISELKKSYGLQ